MAIKFVILCASLAFANAGYLAGEQLAYAAAPIAKIAYSSAPAVSYSSISAPRTVSYGAPLAYAAPALKAVQYAAPLAYAAPRVATYSSAPAVSTVYQSSPINAYQSAYAQPLAYAQPIAKAYSYAPQITYSSPAIGSSAQSTIRSFDGTVSQYAKAVDTAFSSVRKQDTRITNNVYAAAAPVIAAKTISYAAPAVYAQASPIIAAKTLSYSAAPIAAHVSFEGLGAHYAW